VSRTEDPLARAERIMTELREVTREAAGVLKSLQVAAKNAREQVDGYLAAEVQTAINHYTTVNQQHADQFSKDLIADLARFTHEQMLAVEGQVRAAATIDHLCRLIAMAVADATTIGPDGPYLDLSRPINWDTVHKGT
jgi:hypothetical protein